MEHFLCIDGQSSAQSKFIVDIFPDFLKNFDTIIELGTFTGVFAKYLSLNANLNTRIYTYDINPNYREVEDLANTNFIIYDILDPSTILEIKTLIKFGGRVLLLCDGGDKETEFKLYSKFLKTNDIIMAHDYEDNPEEYEIIKNRIGWPTRSESKYKNLEMYFESLNLSKFMYDEFKNVLWGCFIKN